MKTVINYIFENANALLKTIVNTSFDFSSCASMSAETKDDRVNKAKAQKQIAIDTLKSVLTDYIVLSCEEWCKEKKLNYSTKSDSYYGDVIILDTNGKTLYNIDVEVGTKDYIGTPDALTLVNFGQSSVPELGKCVYLCCNETKNQNAIITASKLRNIQKTGTFIVSVNRSKKLNSTIFDNAKISDNKNAANHDLNILYEEDFVPANVVLKLKDI